MRIEGENNDSNPETKILSLNIFEPFLCDPNLSRIYSDENKGEWGKKREKSNRVGRRDME